MDFLEEIQNSKKQKVERVNKKVLNEDDNDPLFVLPFKRINFHLSLYNDSKLMLKLVKFIKENDITITNYEECGEYPNQFEINLYAENLDLYPKKEKKHANRKT